MRVTLSWKDVHQLCYQLLCASGHDISHRHRVYGVPRGGCIVAALVGRPVSSPESAEFIVDDIIDSGATEKRHREQYPDKPFFALIDKRSAVTREERETWIVFPWEVADKSGVDENVERLRQYAKAGSAARKEVLHALINLVDEFIREDE